MARDRQEMFRQLHEARNAKYVKNVERELAEAHRRAEEANRPPHVHRWGNWYYVLDWTHEVHECKECGFAEIRPLRSY